MPRLIDLTGLKVERWTVLGRSARSDKDLVWWDCRCDCGTERAVAAKSLREETSRSCGCLMRETAGNLLRTHGKTNTKAHHAWEAMRARCKNHRNARYALYGGRGISVCQRWELFVNFLEDMGEPEAGLSLDRIDNDGNYEPNNCRWATILQQAQNTSRAIHVEANGSRKCIAEWARELGCAGQVVESRLKRGWHPARAVTEPIHRRNSK